MIVILSYGTGNITAICNIYQRLDVPHRVASTAAGLAGASKLILPGVGAFDTTMELLNSSGLRDPLDHMVLERKVPVLGICVGMQIMASSSEEGAAEGLSWIDGKVTRLDVSRLEMKPSLPHMGWNSIQPTQDHPILGQIDIQKGFYFLHSYGFQCDQGDDVLATCHYGAEVTAAVVRDNIFGFQFHPEKSHHNGIAIFKNFAEI